MQHYTLKLKVLHR